jgi:NAD(P)-dependent dehydrogenase (short-subunit alcohol dehydrogenase family)
VAMRRAPIASGAMASRAALVTGGSSGIGKALARVLGQEGYALTIAGRDERKLASAAQELGGEGIAVGTAAGDVGDEEAVARIVAAHEAAHGRMDALVNAAAYSAGGVPLAQMPTEMLDRHLEVDLRAMFLTIRASLGLLSAAGAEHGKALVVNVSSLAAKGGTPGMSFYAAAKAGVNALTESVQAETRHAGIQFTIFSPGFTATPMAEWTREAGVAPEEMVQPADLGEGLRFLLRTSPTCLVREIEFAPPAQREIIDRLVAMRERRTADRPTVERSIDR